MDGKEFLQKYGLWVGVGAVVLYVLYKGVGGAARSPLIAPQPPGAGGISSDQYRLESERLRAAGALDLERLRLQNADEVARRKADLDRFNLEQQVAAQRRAIDAARRGQTLGLIGNLAKSIADLFKSSSQPKGGSTGGSSGSGGGFPGTPPIAGRARTQLPPAPSYVPARLPDLSLPDLSLAPPPYYEGPFYQPTFEDFGAVPVFESAGMGLDTGATFADQYGGNFYDIYSGNPELNYTNYTDPYDVGAGGDFYYGYGAGDSGDYGYGGGNGGNIGIEDFNYDYGAGGYADYSDYSGEAYGYGGDE